MKIKLFRFLIALITFFKSFGLYAAPLKYPYGQENSIAIREMQATIDDLRHEISNHEIEIRVFEEKLNNQELIIEALRDQNSSKMKLDQESTKGTIAGLDQKIMNLDTLVKSIVSDLKELKTHANQSSLTLKNFHQKMKDFEKTVGIQDENIENFQATLKVLMTILDAPIESAKVVDKKLGDKDIDKNLEEKQNVYFVKSGDSLEKIAKAYKTSVKAIKEFNNLTTDRIVVGQNIKIPNS